MQFERDPDPAAPTPPSALLAGLLAVPTSWAWAGAGGALLATARPELAMAFPALVVVIVLFAVAAAVARVTRRATMWAAEGTWLVAVPAWGLALDLVSPVCDHGCEDTYQPITASGLALVYTPYVVGLLGWLAHRLRPDPLAPLLEGALLAALAAGVTVCAALALQFGPMPVYGLVFAPMGLPLVAPWIAGGALALAFGLRARQAVRPALGAAITTAAWLGLDLALHAVLTGRLGLWGGAFGDTCGWVLSTRTPPAEDCHYLCTVAAQGHPWLVRPLRLGERGGKPILVNRQLAVANAFEDLLRERWPRFGRGARRVYDRLAFPVSRYLTNPWVADAVFVAMWPAQLGFELTLRLLDDAPERRLDRMYRPRAERRP